MNYHFTIHDSRVKKKKSESKLTASFFSQQTPSSTVYPSPSLSFNIIRVTAVFMKDFLSFSNLIGQYFYIGQSNSNSPSQVRLEIVHKYGCQCSDKECIQK
uniref:Uncharacterized protein n=1 Tax=Cacopsylla melanoneura TaxID=428564 RepID=A0A8D8XQM2_9HEMI